MVSLEITNSRINNLSHHFDLITLSLKQVSNTIIVQLPYTSICTLLAFKQQLQGVFASNGFSLYLQIPSQFSFRFPSVSLPLSSRATDKAQCGFNFILYEIHLPHASILIRCFFHYQGFPSCFIFIPLYHFYQLTRVQTIILRTQWCGGIAILY